MSPRFVSEAKTNEWMSPRFVSEAKTKND